MIKAAANTKKRYEIRQGELPVSCPRDDMEIWNSHPKVFLPLSEERRAHCPYCDAEFVLID